MSILDKKCYLTANISTSKIENNTITFYNTDRNTSVLYLKLKYLDDFNLDKYLTSEMLNGYTIKLAVVKPKTMELVEMNGVKENDMFKFELPTNFTDQVGQCVCELIISTVDENLTLDEFVYSIKESATTKFNAEIEPNPDLPILKQLIEQVRELIKQVENGGSGSSHTHNNKSILDAITQEKINNWDGVSNKVDKVSGKQLSTEDYTAAEKQKLSNIDTSLLQPKVDNSLNTTNKTVVGAINELKSSGGSGGQVGTILRRTNDPLEDELFIKVLKRGTYSFVGGDSTVTENLGIISTTSETKMSFTINITEAGYFSFGFTEGSEWAMCKVTNENQTQLVSEWSNNTKGMYGFDLGVGSKIEITSFVKVHKFKIESIDSSRICIKLNNKIVELH